MFSRSSWRKLKRRVDNKPPDSGATPSAESTEQESSEEAGASDENSELSGRTATSSFLQPFRRGSRALPTHSRENSYNRRDDPEGLNLLARPSSVASPTADIIFVHGLGGSSQLTWSKHRDLDNFWPKEWLPLDIPTARIWSFGYDSRFAKQEKAGKLRILDFAKDLLHEMWSATDQDDVPLGTCPIVFVTHSLGGLVFKSAYNNGRNHVKYKNIVAAINAVLFLATPHHGTHHAETLNNLLRVSMVYAPQSYITQMEKDGTYLEEVNEQFLHVSRDLEIFSFYETEDTDLGGGFKPRRIVTKNESVLNYPNEVARKLVGADHHTVCKFDSQQDQNYRKVVTTLKKLVSSPGNNDEQQIICDYLSVSETAVEEDLDFFENRRDGNTCSWILETEQYRDWELKPSGPAVMWLHGKPGRGKSVISSYVIQHLRETGATVQYYFFRYGEQKKRSIGALLRSLSVQLSNCITGYRKDLLRIKNSGFNPKDSDWKSMWRELFKNSLFNLNFVKPIYWIIDAIDESESAESIVDMIRLFGTQSVPIRVLLVSRSSTYLLDSFQELETGLSLSIIPADDFSNDIITYAQTKVRGLRWSEDVKTEIIRRVTERADSNFLWVHLAMEAIKTRNTFDQIMKAINRLPIGMEGIYERMDESIFKNKRDSDTGLQQFIFLWVIYARRPPTTDEFLQALEPEWSLLDIGVTLSNLCGEFIVISKDNRIRLIHETARDYLKLESRLSPSLEASQGHYEIFKKSILSFSPKGSNLRATLDREKSEHLMEYRATAWSYHLSHISEPEHIPEALNLLAEFLSGEPVLTWIRTLSSLGMLKILLETSTRLTKFVQRIPQSDAEGSRQFFDLAQTELLKLWARDLLKLVAKFGNVLRQHPAAIYDSVPSFCPRASGIFKAFEDSGSTSSLTVRGITEEWDDCLARVTVGVDQLSKNVMCSSKFLAVLSSDGVVTLWNCETFEMVHSLPHNEYVQAFRFSRNGDYIVTCGARSTKIWDVNTAETIRSEENLLGVTASALCFSEDDKILLIASDNGRIHSLSVSELGGWQFVSDPPLDDGQGNNGLYDNFPTALSFSPDATKIVAIYRRYPMTIWSVKHPKVVRQMRQLKKLHSAAEDPNSQSFVSRIQWHSKSELLGIFDNGCIFKYDAVKDTQLELEIGPGKMASKVSCSPDGRFFVASDLNGNVKLYDYHNFFQLYGLSNEGVVKDLCFSHDSKRFYDVRRNYCNVWEPNALTRLSDPDDYTSDTQSDLRSVTHSNIPSEAVEDTIEPFTELSPARKGPIVFTSDEDGMVVMHNYTSGARKFITQSPMELTVEHMSWSRDSNRFSYAEIGGRVMVHTLRSAGTNASTALRELAASMRFEPDKEISDIRQTLLNQDGRLVLVSFADRVQIWSYQDEMKLIIDKVIGTGMRWVDSPIYKDTRLLSVTPTTIKAYKWEDLSEIGEWSISDHVRPGSPRTPRPPPTRTFGDAIPTEEDGTISEIRLADSRIHMLLTIPQKTGTRKLRPRHALLDISNMRDEDLSGTNVQEISIPSEIASQIERPLNILKTGAPITDSAPYYLVFLDRTLWLCSCPIDSDLGLTDAKIKRHFFLPRDWVTTDSIRLLHLDKNGTIICPRRGNLVVIESSLTLGMLETSDMFD